jgi:hypothetical protein
MGCCIPQPSIYAHVVVYSDGAKYNINKELLRIIVLVLNHEIITHIPDLAHRPEAT